MSLRAIGEIIGGVPLDGPNVQDEEANKVAPAEQKSLTPIRDYMQKRDQEQDIIS